MERKGDVLIVIKTEIYDQIHAEREREIKKLDEALYSKECKKKEIKYYIALILILLGIGLVGNIELHAEPDYVKANGAVEQTYPATGIITTVATDFIIFTDFNGNEWTINDDPEDWACGDRIAVIMSDNGTPESIYDDKVLTNRYCGWVY